MDSIYILLITLVFFWALYWWFAIISKYSKQSLSKEDRKNFKKKFFEIKNLKSDREKIIFYDKLYHQIFLKLGYKWTFWEILKQKPIQIENLNKIWELHKIRNNLVHEFDEKIEKNLDKKVKEYEYQIEFILW